MRIAEAADHSGLSIDTIRYYEKTGLIPKISRGADGRRRFRAEDVDWLKLLRSLRATGMTMKTMARFAELYQDGDKTIADRRTILEEHAALLETRRRELDQCDALLAHKLQLYDRREASARPPTPPQTKTERPA